MAHQCPDCDRSFVEELLFENHVAVVHADAAADEQQTRGESGSNIAARQAAARGLVSGSIFADPGKAPEIRSTTTITGEPGSFQSKRLEDYKINPDLGPGQEEKQVSDKLAGVRQVGRPEDIADSDDSPEAQQYLMQAWQAMALYLANTDDEDQAAAMQVLKQISNLMSDDTEPNQPLPTGAFGTTQVASQDMAANTFDCPQCSRDFSTEAGLINHLKQVHAAREKETKMRTESD